MSSDQLNIFSGYEKGWYWIEVLEPGPKYYRVTLGEPTLFLPMLMLCKRDYNGPLGWVNYKLTRVTWSLQGMASYFLKSLIHYATRKWLCAC